MEAGTAAPRSLLAQRRSTAWLGMLAAGLPCAVLAAAIAATGGSNLGTDLLMLMIVAISALTGAIIVRARPRNSVGWLLIANANLLAVGGLPDIYLHYSLAEASGTLAGTSLAVYLSDALWPIWFAGVTAIAWVFPDGRLLSPRWRPWAALALTAYLVTILSGIFTDAPVDNPQFAGYNNPLPALPGALEFVGLLGFFGMAASLIAAVVAVATRFRRADGEARLQLLWLLWASLSIPGALVLCIVETTLNNGAVGWLTLFGVIVMVCLIPAAICVALLRYRLFNIELVLSRTLVYGALTVFVAAVYAAVVVSVEAAIGSTTAAGLIGAGVVATLVHPVHAELQGRIDRWVYGDRNDPYAALQRLDARLSESQTPTEALHAVVETVAQSLRLPHSAVEFQDENATQTLAVYGTRSDGELVRRGLWYRGEQVGVLVVEVPAGRPLKPADDRLLDQLASHIGAAVQSVRLTTELQRSRKEIVTAREEERRRLRRDLHDGIGPSLAAMSLQLDVLRDRVERSEADVVERLSGQVQEAITDIRRLVYELRPPALDQYGLISALSEQASRLSSGASSFNVSAPTSIGQLPAAVEVAAYRIAIEAMTNSARHAGASRCDVRILVEDEIAVIVEDDGVGIDQDVSQGVGLRSMRERTAELGGTLSFAGRPGGGTSLVATLPLEQG